MENTCFYAVVAAVLLVTFCTAVAHLQKPEAWRINRGDIQRTHVVLGTLYNSYWHGNIRLPGMI